jgi:hypothetical protein
MVRKRRETSVAQRLRELKHAVPFSPFRVNTTGGEILTLTAPDDFIVSPRGETGFFNPQESVDMKFLYLRAVRTIDIISNGDRRAGRRSNGRRKGKK